MLSSIAVTYHGTELRLLEDASETRRRDSSHAPAQRCLPDAPPAYDGYIRYNVRSRLRHSRLATTEQKYDHSDTV
jgi:hypothetical protein|nr:hypothetical protein [Halorientalis litorea]